MRSKSPHQAEKILAAAAQLFASHRFHEARMEDIAAVAEVGKGTLYRYFKDKEELYRALLLQAAEGLQESLSRSLAQASDPRQQLVAVVSALINYFDEQPHLFDLIQHVEAMQRPVEEFPWQKMRTLTMDLVRDLFRSGRTAGLFAIDDPDLAMFLLLGGIRAVIRFHVKPRPANLAETIVAGFLEGQAKPINKPAVCLPSASLNAPAVQIIDGASPSLHNA